MVRKTFLAIFFVFSLLAVQSANIVSAHHEGHHHDKKCPLHSYKQIHMNMYYELLAEKYAPEKVKVWQDIQNERKKLKESLKGEIAQKKEKLKPWYEEHKELQKQFAEAIEQRDEQRIKELLPKVIDHHAKFNELLKASS